MFKLLLDNDKIKTMSEYPLEINILLILYQNNNRMIFLNVYDNFVKKNSTQYNVIKNT